MTATPVNREEIRMLVLQLGYERTSEQTGIKQATLRQWAKRFAWKVQHSQQTVTSVTRPSQVIADELSENGKETKLKLSRYAKRQAEHLETQGTLKDHRAFKDIAQGAAGLHGWNEKQGDQTFSLNVLNMGNLAVRVGKEAQDNDSTISE